MTARDVVLATRLLSGSVLTSVSGLCEDHAGLAGAEGPEGHSTIGSAQLLAFRSVLVRVLIIVSAAVALATAVLWLMGSPAALASGWSIQRAPELAGAIPGQLNGVSCPSPTACSAVGGYTNVPDTL